MAIEVVTLRHLHPVVGLTSNDTKEFFDLLKKANEEQLKAMLEEINKEFLSRAKNARNANFS